MTNLLRCFFCLTLICGSSIHADEKQLFDGKTLQGWSGRSDLWSVQDGCIVGQTTDDKPIKANTFLILDDVEVSDFEFECQFRFEGNNSGVQYRSNVVDEAGFALAGYQADLHPKANYLGMMYSEKTGRGILATGGQRVVVNAKGKKMASAEFPAIDPPDLKKWNTLRIVAAGNQMLHQINGQTTIVLVDRSKDALLKGRLGLQLHRGPSMKVEFKDLTLNPLEKSAAMKLIQKATASE